VGRTDFLERGTNRAFAPSFEPVASNIPGPQGTDELLESIDGRNKLRLLPNRRRVTADGSKSRHTDSVVQICPGDRQICPADRANKLSMTPGRNEGRQWSSQTAEMNLQTRNRIVSVVIEGREQPK